MAKNKYNKKDIKIQFEKIYILCFNRCNQIRLNIQISEEKIMIYNKKVTAIILAAGNSVRYGRNRNKNFEKINGKPVLQYSIECFDNNDKIDNILIASKENELYIINKIISKLNLNKKVQLIVGGRSRKESVYKCITKTNSDIVIIHDGARPAIKPIYIDKCLNAMKEYRGASVGIKAKDTIKITNQDGIVLETTKRSNTWQIHTPQCFNRKILVKAHENCKDDDIITDDCMLLENLGYKVKLVEDDYTNIKLTNYEDLNILKQYIGDKSDIINWLNEKFIYISKIVQKIRKTFIKSDIDNLEVDK